MSCIICWLLNLYTVGWRFSSLPDWDAVLLCLTHRASFLDAPVALGHASERHVRPLEFWVIGGLPWVSVAATALVRVQKLCIEGLVPGVGTFSMQTRLRYGRHVT